MAALQNTLLRPKLDEDVIPFSEYRQNLTRYFKQTQETHRPILVTQNGRAATIVMNVADFEDTWKVWETLRDQIEMRSDIEAGIRELDAGEGLSHEEVVKNALAERERIKKELGL